MDRDYTTSAEEELINSVEELYDSSNNFSFSTDYTALIPDPPNGLTSYEAYLASCSSLINDYITQRISSIFDEVRSFDAGVVSVSKSWIGKTYSFFVSNDALSGLDSFKNELEKVYSLIDLSALGDSTSAIASAIMNAPENIDGSIFGDSLVYADNVYDLGYEDEAGRSYAYYEEALDRVLNVENGVVTYDMDEVEAILSKDADDITEAEYYAVAQAFTYMNEDDMETTIALLMDDREDVEVGFWDKTLHGSKDYSVWQLDEEKYQNFCDAMNSVSSDNVAFINYCDALCEATGDLTYDDLADAAEKRRMTIVQRNALVQNLDNISEFRGELGTDEPDLEITYDDEGTLSLKYKNKNSIFSGGVQMVYTLYDRTISVSNCTTGAAYQSENQHNICVELNNSFCSGFTSEGYEGDYPYWLKVALGIGNDGLNEYFVSGASDLAENVIGQYSKAIPYVGIIISGIMNGITDYENGIQSAAYMEGVDISLSQGTVYSNFDCDVCVVKYSIDEDDVVTQTSDTYVTMVYAEAGRNTYVRIALYNYYTNGEVTVDDVINNPGELAADINSHSDENKFEIRNVYEANYADIDILLNNNDE